MKSNLKIPYEIDEKLKKSHNLLSKKILKTQTFLVLQQIFLMIMVSSIFFLFRRLFLILLLSFIGVVIFFLYAIIRYIIETITTYRKFLLKEKQNLNYLSEELFLMVKIYTSKFRIFKWLKIRELLKENDVSMDEKMRLIFKHEKNSFISSIILLVIFFFVNLIFGDIRLETLNTLLGFLLISIVLFFVMSFLVLKYTNKWLNGYRELKAWGDLLDKYDIIPKEGYMALLDKDFNNLGLRNDEYCVKCGELLEQNAQFCKYCGNRTESN